jgi:hypothetical protein
MTARTAPTDAHARRGRWEKAKQFARAARIVRELADDEADLLDAYVTLCIHSGIASADVVCAVALGLRARGESHRDAIVLLASVDKEASRHLDTLLGAKTLAGYEPEPIQPAEARRIGRAMEALLAKAARYR